MGSVRSWAGSLLSLAAFFAARRLCYGFALPTFVLLTVACTYLWAFVLRVPELRKPLEPEEPQGAAPAADRPAEAAAPPAAPAAAAAAPVAASHPTPAPAPVAAAASARPAPAPEAATAQEASAVPRVAAAAGEGAGSAGQANADLPTPAAPGLASAAEVPAAVATAEAATPEVEQAAAAGVSPVPVGDAVPRDSSGRGTKAAATVRTAASSPPFTAAPANPVAAATNAASLPPAGSGAPAAASTEPEAAVAPKAAAVRAETRASPAEATAAETTAAAPRGKGGEAGGGDDADSSDGERPAPGEEENEFADLPRAQELRLEGNEHFKAGRLHDAREAYSEAIHLMPVAEKKEKAVLFSNRAACMQKLSRWDDVIADCKQAIDLDPEYVKAYVRRSGAYESQNKWHDAFEDLKKAAELDTAVKSREFRHLAVLEKRAQEQFEKEKEEMFGKLKDLGNTVLGKFGMSVDNFKMEQDPNTGSYSIKYQN